MVPGFFAFVVVVSGLCLSAFLVLVVVAGVFLGILRFKPGTMVKYVGKRVATWAGRGSIVAFGAGFALGGGAYFSAHMQDFRFDRFYLNTVYSTPACSGAYVLLLLLVLAIGRFRRREPPTHVAAPTDPNRRLPAPHEPDD